MNIKVKASIVLLSFLLLFSSSTNAQVEGTINTINQYYHNWLGGVDDVYIDGELAYLACDDDGLRIINVSNFDAIYDLGQYVVEAAISITVDGNYAFLGTGQQGLYIIDISDPENPSEVYNDSECDFINEIEIEGNTAFICHSGGVTILDISDIYQPQTLWDSADISWANAIEIRDNIAYVGSHTPGLVVLDITDSSSPEILYTYQPVGYNYVNGIDVQGNYAYMASGWNGMEVFDLTTHEVVASVDSLVWAFRIEVVDNYVYMTYGDPDCPLAVIDISNPVSPQTMGIYYPPEDLINFMVVDDIAYMADFAHGLRMVDVSIPQEPVETHVYSRYGLDKDVIVRGDYAYVKENIKFKIIDISDMQNPFETGYYEFGWGYNDIHLVGDVAFLSNGGYNCLYALDISDPYSPEVIDIYRDEGNDVHYRMKLHGRYAYIVENYGLEIVDISNPEEMVHAGNYSEYIGNAKIEIADRYLFLRSSSYDDPLEVFDISDPLSPVFVTGYQIGSGLRKMKAADGYLYLITTQHLLIFRATDFRQWQPIANFQVFTDDRRLSDLEIEGNYVYLTCADNGLYMYDISDREDPTYVTNNTTPGSASGVFVTDGIAYVADGSNLGFYDCTGVTGVKDKYQTLPSSFALISSYPNPFNASTRIQFEMSGAGHVTLTVFDVLGQNVSTLANREFEAGTHSLIWNGTGRDGRTVASGRYYIKARTGDSMEKMPITLLK